MEAVKEHVAARVSLTLHEKHMLQVHDGPCALLDTP